MPKTESKPSRKRAATRTPTVPPRKPSGKSRARKPIAQKPVPAPGASTTVADGEKDLSLLPEANRKALRELDAYVAAHPPRTELGRLAIELRRLCLLEGEKLLSDEEFWEQIDRERGRN